MIPIFTVYSAAAKNGKRIEKNGKRIEPLINFRFLYCAKYRHTSK
jgi:hypothetical protein